MTEITFKIPDGYIQTDSAVEGITVYKPEEKHIDTAPKIYTCPRCGASTRYDVSAGGIACEYCGYTASIISNQPVNQVDRFEFTLDNLNSAACGWGNKRREIHCEACGAVITLAEGAITSTCIFCASNHVSLREAPSDKLQPRSLIPFQITAADLTPQITTWLGKGWFHPRDLTRSVHMDQFTGIYLPFWVFNALLRCNWSAEVGHTHTVRDGNGKTHQETEWSWRSGKVDVDDNDLLINGGSHINSTLLERIQPFDMGGLTDYSSDYLAGWNAQAYDVNLPDAWEKGKQQMRERARQTCREDIHAAQVRSFSMQANFENETWRYILLPIYLTSYRFGEKVYQVMINGQTGEIAGQKPIDSKKLILAVIALLLPGLISIMIGLIHSGDDGVLSTFCGFFLLVIGVILAVIVCSKAIGSEKV